jgi:hypothetical protein
MLDIQRRHATVYRVRFGETVATKGGKTAPAKLTDRMRVTAKNPAVVDAFTAIYGGERHEWNDQWEAYLPTDALNIYVLPGQSISQWWELYRGSVCQRRCDGYTEIKSRRPCMCNEDPEVRMRDTNQCNPTTRVNIMCPDVDVVGSGAFVTHGLIAAETLPQSIAVAETALAMGYMVPAVLRVVEFKGRNHFIVPQIEIVGVSMNELEAAAQNGGTPALPHATRDLGAPRFTPVKALPAAPAVPIEEQLRSVERPYLPAPRANAAEPIKSTGLDPRTAVEAGTPVIETEGDDESEPGGAPADENGRKETPPLAPADPAGVPPHTGVNRVAIAAREAGLDDDGRHDLAEWASAGRSRSTKDLTADEVQVAFVGAMKLGDGVAVFDRTETGEIFLKHKTYGWPITREGRAEHETASMSLDDFKVWCRQQLEPYGDDGRTAWKQRKLPAIARITDDQRDAALEVVLSLEPF